MRRDLAGPPRSRARRDTAGRPAARPSARSAVGGLVALALALTAACAKPHPPEPDHATPLAYRVEAPSGARAVLLGSIHLAKPDTTRLPPALDGAFARAELLVFEVDPIQMNPFRIAVSMREIAGLPPGERLRDRISPQTWQRLEARAAELGLPIRALDSLEPWAIALQLTAASLVGEGFEPAHGLEERLSPRIAGRPVIGLETLEEQLRIFDELAPALQERMLAEALESQPEAEQTIEALARAWWRGDADALEALLFEKQRDPEMRPFYDATYARRNRRMAERLTHILSKRTRAFVVVGVGHLVGEDNVPRLLEEAGLEVRQVSPQR